MKVYSTKHVLTEGVVLVEGEYIMADRYFSGKGDWRHTFLRRSDFSETWEGALAQAEKKRASAIKSAKTKIVKLEKLVWEKP